MHNQIQHNTVALELKEIRIASYDAIMSVNSSARSEPLSQQTGNLSTQDLLLLPKFAANTLKQLTSEPNSTPPR